LTPEEYLEFDRKAECKSEFLPARMRATVGPIRAHALVAANLVREVGNHIRRKSWEAYIGMWVGKERIGRDYVVVCDTPQFTMNQRRLC
jgi:hypothetical protein